QTSEQRRLDYERLLQLAPSVQEITYLDAAGTTQVRVARDAPGRVVERADDAPAAWLDDARTRGVSFGSVHLRDGAMPVLPIALAERGDNSGLIVAQLSLDPVWAAVSDVSLNESGHAYVVDAAGRLIAHPDDSLVQRGVDLSSSLQVRAVRAGPFE